MMTVFTATRESLSAAAPWLDALPSAGGEPWQRAWSLAARPLPRGAALPERIAQVLVQQGINPQAWRAVDVLRALALARLPVDCIAPALNELLRFADLGELQSLGRGLCFLANPAAGEPTARVLLRHSAAAVFSACALDSPWPAQVLAADAWRQLVLKAVFLDCDLHRVHGLEARHDTTLAAMLAHYANERRAAGRNVNPQLQPWLPR